MYWNVKRVIHDDWIWNGRHFVRLYALSYYNQNNSFQMVCLCYIIVFLFVEGITIFLHTLSTGGKI